MRFFLQQSMQLFWPPALCGFYWRDGGLLCSTGWHNWIWSLYLLLVAHHCICFHSWSLLCTNLHTHWRDIQARVEMTPVLWFSTRFTVRLYPWEKYKGCKFWLSNNSTDVRAQDSHLLLRLIPSNSITRSQRLYLAFQHAFMCCS